MTIFRRSQFYPRVYLGNGEWGMGNGEWGMGNGEWGMGNGEWGMGKKKTLHPYTLTPSLNR
ncbi:hypothetical protein [Anabaena azotica]|uniref:Uncharacterized protein n=1 Tax=Anabaena azotica FACHB-119 TaxID=947527 RepID=A0ABR8D463_9NOST|nr:hypothetical protein [Anabaena azotica]MBD2501962.1 hypothetical protein [Anabaena azotica FACHB-119]